MFCFFSRCRWNAPISLSAEQSLALSVTGEGHSSFTLSPPYFFSFPVHDLRLRFELLFCKRFLPVFPSHPAVSNDAGSPLSFPFCERTPLHAPAPSSPCRADKLIKSRLLMFPSIAPPMTFDLLRRSSETRAVFLYFLLERPPSHAPPFLLTG